MFNNGAEYVRLCLILAVTPGVSTEQQILHTVRLTLECLEDEQGKLMNRLMAFYHTILGM